MQINYQTVTIEALPNSAQLTIDDYFVIAQNHHKLTDTFLNGDWVGKKIVMSDILSFIRDNVPYIYNTAYKYNPSTLSTEVFDNIKGLRIVDNYISLVKDLGTNLLDVSLQLPQDISPASNVTFNNIQSNSISTTTLTSTNLNIASTIVGVITSALKLQTAMSLTLTGALVGTCSFDGSSNVTLAASVNDNSHRHNNTTIDDLSWSKVIDKPSPRINIDITGPITGNNFFDLLNVTDGSVSIATSITPGAVDLITHTTGNYLNHITASGNGLSIAEAPGHNNVQNININAVPTNTPSTVIFRDALGNFSSNVITCSTLIGNITGNLTGNTIGLHTGNVTGNVTGSLTGDVTGNVVGNLTGNVTGNVTGDITGNSNSANRLSSGKTISATGDITFITPVFDGTSNISTVATLSDSGVPAGTYNNDGHSVRPFTVDSKGRVTNIGTAVPIIYDWLLLSGTPTTISGYGISDVYTKSYVDTLALGLKPKEQVKVATITSIALSGNQTIDGISTVSGDRVLVNSQSSSGQNGIYIASSGVWTRALDANDATSLNGALVSVSSGTVNANKIFYQTLNISTIDIDPVRFSVFTSSGAYSPIITGAASTVASANLGASKALISDASGKIAVSPVTSIELGYLSGVTSSIQAQITSKADNTALSLHSSATTGIHGLTGNIVGTDDTQTITNKTLLLSNNNLSGTLGQFNAALSDADFCSLLGAETLQNKTLQSPIIYSPFVTGGTYISSTIYSPIITGGTLNNVNILSALLINGTFISPTMSGGIYNNSTFNVCTFNNGVLNSPVLYTPNIGIATGESFNGFTGLADLDPIMNGISNPGVSALGSRYDHIHPTDTSRSPFNGPGADEEFVIGKLQSYDKGFVECDNTAYDASFIVREMNDDQNAAFESIIGNSITRSYWRAGSFFDSVGSYSYKIKNGLNGYVALMVVDTSGKLLFGTEVDNNTNSKAQFNGNIDQSGIKFSNN